MQRQKTLTMNWDALGENDDDDDRFFETFDRLSSAVPLDLASSGSDEDEFDDSRMSFASAISSVSTTQYRNYGAAAAAVAAAAMSPNYDVWMSSPGSITERRKRLLQGMGLANGTSKELVRNPTAKVLGSPISMKIADKEASLVADSTDVGELKPDPPPPLPPATPSPQAMYFVRCRSDSDIEAFSVDRERKEEMIGPVSKQRVTRTSSLINVSTGRISPYQELGKSPMVGGSNGGPAQHRSHPSIVLSDSQLGAFFLIKSLDNGKEFIVKEYGQDGMWNRLSDIQTGKQLTMEEFEKCVGHSTVVTEVMRRANVSRMGDNDDGNERKLANSYNSYISRSLRMSKRRGAAILKNIKGVAFSKPTNGFRGESSRDHVAPQENDAKASKNSASSSGWVKVRQTGKSYTELSALHLCQEIQAHEGSIWTIKFTPDGRFLASGGEDKIIHVWEVQDCGIMSLQDGSLTPLHPSLSNLTPNLGDATPMSSERRKKKRSSSKRGPPIPDYVHVPETVFSLSEKPVCSFSGHLDDVLDLSWSRSQLLLSSSMDKTVRLWDMETKSCLKLFAHNDYVTCIQFNPMDENYFLSGSLDAKIRIWSIPDRQLVEWTDLHEMITAACYTPDGEGVVIGSHKGGCRMYSAEDCKLNQTEQFTILHRKRPQLKKITGFQFSPINPSEILVTSADSSIRILDGTEVVHKFRGFRNVTSQISASFSLDGKYVICASEDSNVYVWKREEPQAGGGGKGKTVIHTRSHESFQCKDVSVAIPWPGTVRGDPPSVNMNSKRHSKRGISSLPSNCDSPTRDEPSTSSKRHLPIGGTESPTAEDNRSPMHHKKHLPPLPKKKVVEIPERASTTPEDDLSPVDNSDPSVGESSRHIDPSSISATGGVPSTSWSSWSWFDGNSGSSTVQATAWGLVIVTASLGGEIRAYQNFGVPRKIGRQAHLF